jgi:hypothetical protein
VTDELKNFHAEPDMKVKHVVYLVIVLFLCGLDLGQKDADLTTERMTKEQVAAVAMDRTRALVACAKGSNVIVGDVLIECKPIPIPVWERQ